ncbi:MAG: RNA 2',3'-cyclic phosphodiesterase [Roseovarius sp.]
MRSFLAIPVPEEQAEPLLDVQHALEVGRPVPPENWHVTLAFLGNQPEEVLERLHERLAELEAPAFDMRVAGVDIIGGRKPSLLYAGVDKSDALGHLRKKVRQLVRAGDIDLSRERFRPHVTLARFRKRLTELETQRIAGVLEAWGDVEAGVLPVDHFTLYRSLSSPDGMIYEPLADYPLGQRQDGV